jgi:hypothetical protein
MRQRTIYRAAANSPFVPEAVVSTCSSVRVRRLVLFRSIRSPLKLVFVRRRRPAGARDRTDGAEQ